MAGGPGPRIDLRPGPFFRAAANRLDVSSRRGFPVTAAAGIATLAFLGFLTVALNAKDTLFRPLDQLAAHLTAALANPVCTAVFYVITLLADTRVMTVETVVAVVLLAIWGHPRRAGSVAVLVLTGVALSETLKTLVGRSRPDVAISLLAPSISYSNEFSFPSGHALASILLFGSLALMLSVSRLPKTLRTWGSVAVWALALSVGISRVYLGVHYFSDVLASWLLGTTMLATWAAAVLVWGRTHPIAERVPRPWFRLAWRWALAAIGAAAVVAAIVLEAAVTRLR